MLYLCGVKRWDTSPHHQLKCITISLLLLILLLSQHFNHSIFIIYIFLTLDRCPERTYLERRDCVEAVLLRLWI